MELLIFLGVVAIIVIILKKNKKKNKKKFILSKPVPEPEPVPEPVPEPEPISGPCDDKRDRTNFTAYKTKKECNKHGYFWCPLAKKCMPSSINVGECGKPSYLM